MVAGLCLKIGNTLYEIMSFTDFQGIYYLSSFYFNKGLQAAYNYRYRLNMLKKKVWESFKTDQTDNLKEGTDR